MKEGYKKTEVGVIPEDWEVKKLEDICEFLDSMRKPIKSSDREFMKGNIPYYGASGVIDWVNDYIFNEDLILLGEDGENLKSRNVPLAFKVNGKCWVNNHAHVLRCKHGSIDFITEVLESKDYTSYIIGSAQPKLTQAQCRKILLQVPSLKEQEKIAEILSTVDTQIDDTDKLIEKCRVLKKGLMQRLLTKGIGHSEFKNTQFGFVPNEWSVKKIGDIYHDLKSGATPSRSNPGYFKGDIPWITSGELKSKNVCETNEYITKEAVADTNLKIYDKGTFFIAITGLEAEGTRGSCGINNMPATTNQSCLAFIEKDEIDNQFIYYWYLLHGEYIGIKFTQGTKQQSLNNKIVEEFEIGYPNKDEQKKIIEILSSIDIDIDEYENKRIKLECLKKGLMQQLLTGKVRTV